MQNYLTDGFTAEFETSVHFPKDKEGFADGEIN